MLKKPSLAKVCEPQVSDVLERRGLYRQLDFARRRPLVWVSAPAGSGKTTLLASYLRTRGGTRLWYKVDSRDSDAASFFFYLRLAAQPFCQEKDSLPTLPAAGPADVFAFARHFFEQLFALMPSDSVLVLDDYHEVSGQAPLHELLRVALTVLPHGDNIIVLSRKVPPAAMAAPMAASQVAQLGWEALRFSEVESAALGRLRGGAGVDGARLHRLADGWAAGLVLLVESGRFDEVALSLAEEEAAQRVFDYFASEIFAACDRSTQDFLLRTALLPDFTVPIAESLLGSREARAIATRLEREQFFLTRIDGPAPSYRYHPLFRAFLLDRGRHCMPSEELASWMRAAGMLLAEQRVEDAFDLLLDAGDLQGCAALVRRWAPQLLADGRRALLKRWISALPAEKVQADGWLLYYLGVCRLGSAPVESGRHLAAAAGLFRSQGERLGLLLTCISAAQAVIHEGNDFRLLEPWIESAQKILDEGIELDSDDLQLQVAGGMLIALSNWKPGSQACADWAERTLELIDRPVAIDQRAMSAGALIIHHAFRGHLGPASMVLDRIHAQGDQGLREPIVKLTLRLAETMCAWVRGEHGTCLVAVQDCFAIARESGFLSYNPQAASTGVAAALASGQLEQARAFLGPMSEGVARAGRFGRGNYQYYASWDALLRGELPRACESARAAVELGDACGFPYAGSISRLALALTLRELGRSEEAWACLDWVQAKLDELGSDHLRYTFLLVAADLALRDGEKAKGLACLEQGLRLGREQDISNMFWFIPQLAERLTVQALEAGLEVPYVRTLVKKWRVRPSQPPLHLVDWPWPVQVHTLGRFQIRVDGTPLTFKGKAQEMPLRLLGALIAFGAREVSAGALMEALWPDSEGDAARRVLDTTLHRLRRLLGVEDAIPMSNGYVRLDPSVIWVDALALEDMLRTPQRSVSSELAEQLIALYRGPFLADSMDPWTSPLRERLHGRFLRALLGLGLRLEETAASEQALELYLRGLEIDDTGEALYRAAMRCSYRLGRETEELRLYLRCKSVLQRRLGVGPSSETEALHRELLSMRRS